jgi:predicted nucleic acid-binding protein
VLSNTASDGGAAGYRQDDCWSLYASIIQGQLEVADAATTDSQRIQDLVGTYADLRLGGTDASVIALAERQGAVRIAPLNRRHCAVVRPRHADAFELLP